MNYSDFIIQLKERFDNGENILSDELFQEIEENIDFKWVHFQMHFRNFSDEFILKHFDKINFNQVNLLNNSDEILGKVLPHLSVGTIKYLYNKNKFSEEFVNNNEESFKGLVKNKRLAINCIDILPECSQMQFIEDDINNKKWIRNPKKNVSNIIKLYEI